MGFQVVASVQGARAVAEHFATVARITDDLTKAVVATSGTFLANLAGEIHRPHILTGATFRSIDAGIEGTREALVHEAAGHIWVDVGASTPQSLFLEWGFLHPSGQWVQYPFMIPAADQVEPMFFDAMEQVALVAEEIPFVSGLASGTRSILHSVRNQLYSFSKFAGDIQAFTGFTGFAGFRGYALTAARGIGDLEASMRGAIGTRITHRAVGRFVSGGLATTRSAIISGPSSQFVSSSQRLYNRVIGRGIGTGLRF